jgi:hypothetical protein
MLLDGVEEGGGVDRLPSSSRPTATLNQRSQIPRLHVVSSAFFLGPSCAKSVYVFP